MTTPPSTWSPASSASAAYGAVNAQGLVPALDLGDGQVLTQSLAILEWLEETHPEPPTAAADRRSTARSCGPWPGSSPATSIR